MMKTVFVLISLCLFISCSSTKRASNRYGEELFKGWVHAFEEKSAEGMVFRPSDTPMRPARNREGFEFNNDGTFIHTTIGMRDFPEKIKGTWEMKGSTFFVSFPESEKAPLTFKVIQCREDQLIIEKQ